MSHDWRNITDSNRILMAGNDISYRDPFKDHEQLKRDVQGIVDSAFNAADLSQERINDMEKRIAHLENAIKYILIPTVILLLGTITSTFLVLSDIYNSLPK